MARHAHQGPPTVEPRLVSRGLTASSFLYEPLRGFSTLWVVTDAQFATRRYCSLFVKGVYARRHAAAAARAPRWVQDCCWPLCYLMVTSVLRLIKPLYICDRCNKELLSIKCFSQELTRQMNASRNSASLSHCCSALADRAVRLGTHINTMRTPLHMSIHML